MGKKLAIRGHSTRGKEVIELLEMMGGKNIHKHDGGSNSYSYYISGNAILHDRLSIAEDDDFEIFNLQDFLEKYPYKIGDKIPAVWGNPCTVKSMSWDENYKTVMYGFEETVFVVRGDELYVNNIINNHTESTKMKNVLAELLDHIKTTPKEELEKEFKEIEEWSNVGPTVEEFMTFCECVNKKPKYPETYKECCDALNLTWNKCFVMFDIDHNGLTDEENNLYESLIKLKRCRDAYWKIAGEEMGLGKPWEPDWNDSTPKYTIVVIGNDLVKHYTFTQNFILAFPTEEMRDIFYENFKNLIEECKELL